MTVYSVENEATLELHNVCLLSVRVQKYLRCMYFV